LSGDLGKAKRDLDAATGEPSPEEVRASEKVKHDKKHRALRAERNEFKALAKELEERVEDLEKMLDTHAAVLSRKDPVRPIRPNAKGGGSESTLIAIASDWHVEEIVEADTVNGRNAYTPEIAERRAEQFFRSVVKAAERARPFTRVPHLVLGLLGDFITGWIHDELKASTAMPPLEAIEFVRRLLTKGLLYLIDEGGFDRIIVPTCFGNHGRTSMRPMFSKAAETNLEFYLYRRLVEDFEDSVEFIVSKSLENEGVEVYGRRARFHHGEQLRYAGGLQGFYGRLYKYHLEKNRVQSCAWSFVGHWHTFHAFYNIGGVNGSLIGDSAFGSQYGSEPPRQLFALVEKDQGIASMGPLYVT